MLHKGGNLQWCEGEEKKKRKPSATERQAQEPVGSKFDLGHKRVTIGLMVFLCSICSLENGLSSRFRCEHKRRRQAIHSTLVDSPSVHSRAYALEDLGVSGDRSPIASCVCLWSDAVVGVQSWFPGVRACLFWGRHVERRGTESVHLCHARCVLRPVPRLSLQARREEFSCSQRHFAWWAWPIAPMRTDRTTWRETGKDTEGGSEGWKTDGKEKQRKEDCGRDIDGVDWCRGE